MPTIRRKPPNDGPGLARAIKRLDMKPEEFRTRLGRDAGRPVSAVQMWRWLNNKTPLPAPLRAYVVMLLREAAS